MDRRHALQHLYELRARVTFLRAMRPDSPSYKLWLGDVAEFGNTIWGVGAAQPRQLAAVLRQPSEKNAGDEDATARYVRRLSRIDAVLAEWELAMDTPAPGGQA